MRFSIPSAVSLGLAMAWLASSPALAASPEPLVIQDQGSFAAGGTVLTAPGTFDPRKPLDPAGQTFHGDHVYAFYQVPVIVLNRPDQLRSHMGLALRNGVTPAELTEVGTHLAFYVGWPAAASAIPVRWAAPPRAAAVDHFTGQAQVSAPFQAESPVRASGGIVSFAPGARALVASSVRVETNRV